MSDYRAGLRRRRAWVQIAVATLSGNSLKQTVHTHRASVHQAAKLVAAVLRVVRVTAGLTESSGSLQPGLWFASPAGWLQRTEISSETLHSVIEYGLPLPFRQSLRYYVCLGAKRKDIRTVPWCVVYDSCAQWYDSMRDAILTCAQKLTVSLIYRTEPTTQK